MAKQQKAAVSVDTETLSMVLNDFDRDERVHNTFTGEVDKRYDAYRGILDLVRSLQAIAEPAAVVAVVWAGTPAYFSDFRLVDTLGYNDRHVARGKPVHELTEDNFEEFLPGHVKWDYPYLLDHYRPDAFLQLWGGHEVIRLLRSRGYRRVGDLWVDPASPRIHLPAAPLPGASPASPAEAGSPAEPPGSPAEAAPPSDDAAGAGAGAAAGRPPASRSADLTWAPSPRGPGGSSSGPLSWPGAGGCSACSTTP